MTDYVGPERRHAALTEDKVALMIQEAVSKALDEGKVYAYVCDFPSNLLKNHPRAITLPHLGASTKENLLRISDIKANLSVGIFGIESRILQDFIYLPG